MKIEQLVPPLADCQNIPAGSFPDSAFVWHRYNRKDTWGIARRGLPGEIIPAPTLAEIMEKLPHGVKCQKVTNYFVVIVGFDYSTVEYDANPASAALRMWLKIKRN